MIDFLILQSLKHRFVLLCASIIVVSYGLWVALNLPIDVFPDLNRPKVTILTEAHGLAPEEVETLVTLPIESSLMGIPGVVRVQSSSGIGISVINVEFDWETDTFRNRQLVAEQLRIAKSRMPPEMDPIMGPISSIMGEIQFVGLRAENDSVSSLDLRSTADWIIRPRLMSIPGISQVVVMGGGVKQYQILVSSEKLQDRGLSLETLKHSLSEISENTTGGFINIEDKEYLIRPIGRVETIEEIENSLVSMHFGRPVLVKDVAVVRIAPKIKRGEASINAQRAVVLTIQKQPGANTIELTKLIDAALEDLQPSLPKGMQLLGDLFKQSHFIHASISNVREALRDGAIMVAIILFLFLMNFRTTTITLVTIPVSLLVTAIVFRWLGLSVNTMTLGGLAIAIGELVDDAIVDVENVFRRLKENRQSKSPKNSLKVIFEASSEVRNSIVFSTIIVVLVFVPLFAMSGIEGRLFRPLGIAYIISLTASLFVSLTLTPVLCSFLLPKSKTIEHEDGWLVRKLKGIQRVVLVRTLHRPTLVLGGSVVLLLAALALVPFMGHNFLPTFNEGTATIGVAAAPGISLLASDALGTKVEQAILSVPEVKSTVRRTGRAEMDEHAEGVHWSEIDVDFKEGGRLRPVVLNEVREKIEAVGDVYVNIGQPISHRLDHMMSGVRAQIAVKFFGHDISQLRRSGNEAFELMKGIPGIVDLQIEPLVLIPQLKMAIDRQNAARFGISAGALAEDLEIALNGVDVATVMERQRLFNIFMRLDDGSRSSPEAIKKTPVKVMPSGEKVAVEDVAEVYQGSGPNMINRENMQRRLVVSANSKGRDLGSVMQELQRKIKDSLKLPEGYFVAYGGQYESQQLAMKLIAVLGTVSLLGVFLVLFYHFRSVPIVLQVMMNIPLALIGSIVAVFLTERVFSVATLVAFITLCGIASRNGIMMISHYIHLMKHEGENFDEKMIIRGSQERLIPVLMTAFTAILALVPLLFASGEPGKEILHPVAVVIVGGLLSSTLLDILVTPPIFYRFGRRSMERLLTKEGESK